MRIWKISPFVIAGLLVLVVLQQHGYGQQLAQPVAYSNAYLDAYRAHSTPTFAAHDPLLVRGQQEGLEQQIGRTAYTARSGEGKAAASETGCAHGCEDACSCPTRRCGPCWVVFGEFLYLRPRNAEVVYAVPFDGPATPPDSVPIQVGPMGVVDPEYDPGFRVGFSGALSEFASLGAAYTQLDTSTSSQLNVTAPIVIRSMVIHPSTQNAAHDWLSARATYDVNFKLADLDYRSVFAWGEQYEVNYLIGVRYGKLDQYFRSEFTDIGVESINTDIHFDGGGIRLGLEGERYASSTGFLVYAKALASFVAGEFRGSYFQGSTFDPEIVDTRWKAGRIVSMLDLELGVGWATRGGRFRVMAGYMVSAWFNTVTTADFIDAVQRNDFDGLSNTSLSNTITFDGLVARAELRF